MLSLHLLEILYLFYQKIIFRRESSPLSFQTRFRNIEISKISSTAVNIDLLTKSSIYFIINHDILQKTPRYFYILSHFMILCFTHITIQKSHCS